MDGAAHDAFLGIDFGTSGCRAAVIDTGGRLLGEAQCPYPDAETARDPAGWWRALAAALAGLPLRNRIRRLAVDGTSGTLVPCDTHGHPLAPVLLYNDARATAQAVRIAAVAPPQSAAHGASGGLAKLLWYQDQSLKAAHALPQADWIAGRLTGHFGHSDYHNCFKLGYDAERLEWPAWLDALGVRRGWLPQVQAPGTPLGRILPEYARELGLPPETEIVAGTTDGVAAFLAAGVRKPGQGVTSLGSTLVLKLLSDKPVTSAAHGVYSHRLGRRWLAGGASNSGGAVLAKYFSPARLRALTPRLHPDRPTGLDYYPLAQPGERFPLSDPGLMPRLDPRPADEAEFLQALFEGMARIEARGYALLAELGAPRVTGVFTAGGGAQNPAWERIRARALGIPLRAAVSEQAAYGTARLAAGLKLLGAQ